MPFTIGGDYIPPQNPPSQKSPKKPLKIRIEKRKQSVVTLIENLDLADHDLKNLLSELKKKFSCGGTIKDRIISLQGNYEEALKNHFKK